MNLIILTLASVSIVSLVSFIGLTALSFGQEATRKSIAYFVSFATGALLGDAFLYLLPTALQSPATCMTAIFGTVLGGILLFSIIETMLHWHDCSTFDECPHKKPHVIMSIFGNGVHNIIDGIIIAGSFLVSVPLGITTTLAIALHKIPQEISNFGMLLQAGFSLRKALTFHIFAALIAIASASLVLFFRIPLAPFKAYIIALTAGGFISIAGNDLLPNMSSRSIRGNIAQIIFLISGVGVMVALHTLQ